MINTRSLYFLLLITFFSNTCLAFDSVRPFNERKILAGDSRTTRDLEFSVSRTARLIQFKQTMQIMEDEINSQVLRGGIVAENASIEKPTPSTPGNLGEQELATFDPNDPLYSAAGSWGLRKINANAAWDFYKGEGVKIGIVDTGVLFDHEDIDSNIWTNSAELGGLSGVDDDNNGYVDDIHGWDFVDDDNTPFDLNGHGTHVAGIAAAEGNNQTGISGVAPLAKVIPVRVLDQSGSGSIRAVAKGIEYAAKVGADVINLSLGAMNLDFFNKAVLQRAVDFARSLGRIVVAAAGNSATDVSSFSPANLNGVIAVGATDSRDQRAGFSNYGSGLFITAPGVGVLSLGGGNGYFTASGTSMAAPYVSGAIALLLEKYPGASLHFIAMRLLQGAVDLGTRGWDPLYGYGRLDVAASLGLRPAVQISAVLGAVQKPAVKKTIVSILAPRFSPRALALPDFYQNAPAGTSGNSFSGHYPFKMKWWEES